MLPQQEYTLLAITLGAATLPGLARILKLPGVVMELLFGVALGSVFGLTPHGEWLPFLAELGFLLLMFQAGMEINVSMLARQEKREFLLQLAVFGGTLCLAYLASLFLGQGPFLALVLSTTSLGIVAPVLKERGLSSSLFGQRALMAAMLADFATLFAITFFLLYVEQGLTWQFLTPLPLFIGFGLLLRLARNWAWWHPKASARLLGSLDSQELGVRFSFALLFLLVALSELSHVEPVLGAFLGGATLAFVFRERGHLELKLSGLGYGFLIPLFFIHVGMNFDLANVLTLDRVWLTLGLLLAALSVKLPPAFLFSLPLTSRRMPPGRALGLGLLISSRLSLIIAAASLGMEKGLISAAFKDKIILLAIITCMACPVLARTFLPQPPAKTAK